MKYILTKKTTAECNSKKEVNEALVKICGEVGEETNKFKSRKLLFEDIPEKGGLIIEKDEGAGVIPIETRLTIKKFEPIVINKVGRNDPCPCGSGEKYKRCHGKK